MVVGVVVRVSVAVKMAAGRLHVFQRGKMSGNDEWCRRV